MKDGQTTSASPDLDTFNTAYISLGNLKVQQIHLRIFFFPPKDVPESENKKTYHLNEIF